MGSALSSGSADGRDSGSGDASRTGSGVSSRIGSGVGSLTGSGVGSRIGSGVGSRTGSGVGSRIGSGVGSRIGSGVGSRTGSGVTSNTGAETGSGPGDGSTTATAGGSCSFAPTMAAAAVAIAAAAATAADISFSGSAAGLGPRFTGVGVLEPTGFLGVEVFAAADLDTGVLEASLEGALLSLGRLGVFVSAALLAGGFLAVTSDFEADLGVSGFADLVVADERVRGDSAGFLDAGVAGFEASGGQTQHKKSLNNDIIKLNCRIL